MLAYRANEAYTNNLVVKVYVESPREFSSELWKTQFVVLLKGMVIHQVL